MIGVVLVYLGLLAPTIQSAVTAAFIIFAELAAPWAVIVGVGFVLTRGHYDADDLQVFNRGLTGGRTGTPEAGVGRPRWPGSSGRSSDC